MLASARRRAWRMAGVCGLAPVYGRNVGRAISPAAGTLRHRRVSGTMQASSPTEAGQGSAGPCRIFLPLTGNAPLRLRLAAHPPPLAGEALGGLPPGRLPCKGLRSRAPPAAEKAVSHTANGRHSFHYRLFGDRKHRTALRSPLRSLPLRGNAAVAERKCASAHAARCGHRKPVMSAKPTEGCRLPAFANTLPVCLTPPRPCGAALTQNNGVTLRKPPRRA